MPNKTFVRITNQMIYDKITGIDKKVSQINGKVKWHTWAIGVLVVLLAAVVSGVLN